MKKVAVARVGLDSVTRLLETKGWSVTRIDDRRSTRLNCVKKNRQPVTIQVRTARMKGRYPFIVAKSTYKDLTDSLKHQVAIAHVFVPLRLHDLSIEGYYPVPAADVRRLATEKFDDYWVRGRGSRGRNPNGVHAVCIWLDHLPPYRDRWDLIGID
ncbi:MAG: hypothetical protein A2Y91_06110 [Chloroflexi bacterium RBG_13_54_8]|nr:MAG: hypothetical protein A2Y91_06110 [Chloroflexi bacterium RBG_13_54_8]